MPELAAGEGHRLVFPVQLQLLGGDPEKLARSAVRAVALGAAAIDLNFGCPAPTVNRHDGGATLLKYPHRLREIVHTIREALPRTIPLSAKLRLGWDDKKSIFQNAEMAAEGGAAWITIHGRTRLQGYAPPADWEIIGRVRESLPIPVVANGDIWSLEDFRRCREETGCEHFMLGRGLLADPRLARQLSAELGMGHLTDLENDWSSLLDGLCRYVGERKNRDGYLVRRSKQWLKLASNRNQFKAFDAVKTAETMEGLIAAIGSCTL